MLDYLFRRLTADSRRGEELFKSLTRIAREPHWYVEGDVPDTLDGRFAVLATVTAFAFVRLEAEGEEGNRASVALTERFIEVMESEHRELGMGDPTLGRTVRRLVGSLARRTDLWRTAVSSPGDWAAAAQESLYKSDVSPNALKRSVEALKDLWAELGHASLAEIAQGKF